MEGWNLFSTNFDIVRNGCQDMKINAIYVYDRKAADLAKTAVSLNEIEKMFPKYASDEIQYLKKAPAMMYVSGVQSCEVRITVPSASTYQKAMKTGRNLVQITPEMVGKKASDTTSRCNSYGVYELVPGTSAYWNPLTASRTFGINDVGYSVLVIVKDDCQLA